MNNHIDQKVSELNARASKASSIQASLRAAEAIKKFWDSNGDKYIAVETPGSYGASGDCKRHFVVPPEFHDDLFDILKAAREFYKTELADLLEP